MNNRITLALTTIMTTLAVAGCATTAGTTPNTGEAINTATGIGMNVFKVAVDNKCRSEIEKQNFWRVASIAMTEQQKEAVQTKVCGCVSEQAPQQLTIVDMTNAAIDANYRAQLVTKVVAKSLQSCYSSIVQ